MQQQWCRLQKQEQEQKQEATKSLRQACNETNSDPLERPVTVGGTSSNMLHRRQQEWDWNQEKRLKMFLETNSAQQNHLGSVPRPFIDPRTYAMRITQFLNYQKRRPADNNIGFWRKFVDEFFTPHGKEKKCFSCYEDSNQTRGVFAQSIWHCGICHSKPTRGFEFTGLTLPSLYKTKYDTGVLEESLYMDMPQECKYPTGEVVLLYDKVRECTVFEKASVIREGQLRVVFTPNVKICSLEFCIHRHEVSIRKSVIAPQINTIREVTQMYQNSARKAMVNPLSPDLSSTCERLVESASQLQKSFEVPQLNNLGYTAKYMRRFQMSEVMYGMKSFMDFNVQTCMRPLENYSILCGKNLPELRKNIDNGARNSGINVSSGSNSSKGNNATAIACMIGDSGAQDTFPGSGSARQAHNPSGVNNTSSQGSTNPPEKSTSNGVIGEWKSNGGDCF